jgi:hypothetical protein
VVLTDFGVAAVDGESLATSSGLVVGSPQYMAPERVRDGSADPSADLWSLGATLYAAVEGRSPYDRGTVMETITAIASAEPDPPSRAGVLGPVLDGLLRKDPAERIDTAEAEKRLRAALTADATAAAPAARVDAPAPPAGPAVPAWWTGRRRPPLIAGIAAAAVVAGASVAWLAWPDAGETRGAAPRPSVGVTEAAPASSARPSSARPSSGPASPASTRATSPAASSPSTLPPRPDGWIDYRDPTGFAVYVPAGWTRSNEGTMVYFRSPGRVLGIDQTDEPAPDPVADWRGKADYRVERGDFPGYREIRIDPVDYFREAADWEFTFNRSGTRQHVNNRGVVTSKDQAYGIYWQTSDAAWDGARDDLQLIFDSFRPARD